MEVSGGAQEVDGFWSAFRAATLRPTVNTGGAGSTTRQLLEGVFGVSQWRCWNLHGDRFWLRARRPDSANA